MDNVQVVRILPRITRRQKSGADPKSYAPFLSTVDKSPKVRKSYSPSSRRHYQDKIQEPVQRQNNSMVSYSPDQEGSPPFKDATSRFRYAQVQSPGPGSYFNQVHHKQINRSNINALDHYKVRFPEMYANSRSVSIQSYTKHRTPPSQIKNKQQKQVNQSDWAKLQEGRFNHKREESKLGPGYYNISKEVRRAVKKAQSPEFSSLSARSFMDSIIYDSNLDSNKVIPHYLYKKDRPGPGSYDADDRYSISKSFDLKEHKSGLQRRRKPRLNNLSNLLGKMQHRSIVQPILYIHEITPPQRLRDGGYYQ